MEDGREGQLHLIEARGSSAWSGSDGAPAHGADPLGCAGT